MAVMQVNVPERKPGGFSQLWNMGTQGAQMYSQGSGIASLFGGAAGGAGGAGAGLAMAGPIAIGIGGMALGAKADIDYAHKGSSSPLAKYSSKGRGPTTAATSADAGKDFNKGIDAMSRRISSTKMGNPEDILKGGKDALGGLKIDDPTKALIGKKLDLGLSQLFKLKA